MKRSEGGSGGVGGDAVREHNKADFDIAIVRFKKKDFEGERMHGSIPSPEMLGVTDKEI